MGEAPETLERDGVLFARDFAAEGKGRKNTAWSTPLLSEAAGVNPCNIPEAVAADRANGMHVEYCQRTGRAKYTSREQRAKHVASLGMIDRDGGYAESKYTPVNKHVDDPYD